MVRWVCLVKPNENVDFETLLTQLNIRGISDNIRTGRLRWPGTACTDQISDKQECVWKKSPKQTKTFLG